ncbi:MAG: hypothetical protein ABI333_29395 [bacterium]
MFVCPKCDEEIPSRVKKTTEECPFCHEPWPPDEVEQEAAPEPAERHPEGWGDEFKPSAAPSASGGAAHAEPPPKSKAWIGIVAAVVLIGGGAGAYFVLGNKGKKGGKAGGGSAKGGAGEGEFTAIDAWYREARKKLFDFLGEQCKQYHSHGYKFNSHFIKETSFTTIKGKKEAMYSFKLKVLPDPAGKPEGEVNIFACPGKLAEVHRDHPFIIQAEVWEKREVFGAVLKYANIDLMGKLTSHLKVKKVKNCLASQTREGFALPRMKSLPKTKAYEGLRALAKPQFFKMGPAAKTFKLANLTFKKVKYGKYLEGTWKMMLRSNEFKKQIKDWDDGCLALRNAVGKLDKPKKSHQTHLTLVRDGRRVIREICSALTLMSEAMKGTTVDQAKLNQANTALLNARTVWNKEVFQKMADIGKKVDNVVRGKPL